MLQIKNISFVTNNNIIGTTHKNIFHLIFNGHYVRLVTKGRACHDGVIMCQKNADL